LDDPSAAGARAGVGAGDHAPRTKKAGASNFIVILLSKNV